MTAAEFTMLTNAKRLRDMRRPRGELLDLIRDRASNGETDCQWPPPGQDLPPLAKEEVWFLLWAGFGVVEHYVRSPGVPERLVKQTISWPDT